MPNLYTFREITNSTELEGFLRMRYEVYHDIENKVFLKKNIHSIDIGCCDEYSRHYGLFCDNYAVGYLRFVLPKNEFVSDCTLQVQNNLSQHISIPKIKQYCSEHFPFLSYPGIPVELNEYYTSQKSLHRRIIEASRFIVHPKYRMLKISRFIVECGITLYALVYDKYDVLIVNCLIHHASFYKSYGLIPIVRSDGYNVYGVQLICLSLQLNEESIPLKFKDLFQSMAEEFSKTNQITRTL